MRRPRGRAGAGEIVTVGKGCFLILLLLVGVGVGLYLADGLGDDVASALGFGGTTRRATATRAPIRTEPEAEEPAADLDTQVAEAATAVAEDQPFTVVISEAEANARLAESGEGVETFDTPIGEARMRDLRVRFDPGEAAVEANAVTGALTAPVAATFDLSASPEGRPLLTVRSMDVSGVPLPGTVRDRLRDALQQRLDTALGDMPAHIDAIEVQSGQVVVTGSR
jgi:hypothetical protein